MANLILFINSFLSYLLVFVVIVVLIAIAVKIGITTRKNQDAKVAALDAMQSESDTVAKS